MKSYDEFTINHLIGQNIRKWRRARNLTQAQLAVMLEVTRTSITNLESGKQKIPLYLIYELCSTLDVNLLDLIPDLGELSLRNKPVPPKTAEFIQEILSSEVL